VPQSAPLAAAATSWQGALAAYLGATATAMQTAVANPGRSSWTGPTSAMMGGSGEQHVHCLCKAAAQAEESAALPDRPRPRLDAV